MSYLIGGGGGNLQPAYQSIYSSDLEYRKPAESAEPPESTTTATEKGSQPEATEPTPAPSVESTTAGTSIMDWLPAIIAGVVVILGAVQSWLGGGQL